MYACSQRPAEIIIGDIEDGAIIGQDRHYHATGERRFSRRRGWDRTPGDKRRRLLRGAIVNPQREPTRHQIFRNRQAKFSHPDQS
jgi:hypothetical protein